MRIRYWSSDGCSSDLLCDDRLRHDQHVLEDAQRVLRDAQRIFQPELGARTLGHALDVAAGGKGAAGAGENDRPDRFVAREIAPDVLEFPMLLGADRKRGSSGNSVAVRVDLGGRRIIKKKKK